MADKAINTYLAANPHSIFLFPIDKDNLFSLACEGARWRCTEGAEALRHFADRCSGFNCWLDADSPSSMCYIQAKRPYSDQALHVTFHKPVEQILYGAFADGGVVTANDLEFPKGTTELLLCEQKATLALTVCSEKRAETTAMPANANPDEKTDVTREENARLHAENEDLRRQIDGLLSKIEVLEKQSGEANALRSELKQLQDENDTLRNGEAVSAQNSQELERLRNVVTKLADEELQEPIVEDLDEELNGLLDKLNEQRALVQSKKASCAESEEELQQLNAELDRCRAETQALQQDIQKAEELLKEIKEGTDEKEKQLQQLLEELGMERKALQLYSDSAQSEERIKQIQKLKEEAEAELKTLIEKRQEQIGKRLKQVTT